MSATAVAATARALSRLGLVSAFGHVSAREGERLLVTSTAPLAVAGADSVLAVDPVGETPAGAPLELPLHAAIYRDRPDVGAICRTHSPYAVLWGALPEVPPLAHGLGGLSGAVGLHRDPELVVDPDRAAAASAELGAGGSLLLAANGALAVGADLPEALARAWYLEDRCRVAWLAGERAGALNAAPEADGRAAHYAAELARARRWATTVVEEEGGKQ